MKTTIFKRLLFSAFLILGTYTYSQVGIGTTGDPDPSSMLDIQSTSKGVLIPRMTTAQRTAITILSNGLLVFDTTTKSFWFYNGTATVPAWKELVSGNSLVDTDGDTRVEVEKVPDTDSNGDEINFTTRGTERMKIDANGVIIMGDSTATTKNYTKITTDGSLSYVGNATRWDDLKIPVNAVKVKESDLDPAIFADFLGIGLLRFQKKNLANQQNVYFTVQMPHAWKEGTNIFPHVHWSLFDAPTPDVNATVAWGLVYYWANLNGTFSTINTITGNTTVLTSTLAQYKHLITKLGTSGIDGSGKTLSSMLVCRLYRFSSDTSDTMTGDAALLEIDFHYQIDSDGSNTEYGKTN